MLLITYVPCLTEGLLRWMGECRSKGKRQKVKGKGRFSAHVFAFITECLRKAGAGPRVLDAAGSHAYLAWVTDSAR